MAKRIFTFQVLGNRSRRFTAVIFYLQKKVTMTGRLETWNLVLETLSSLALSPLMANAIIHILHPQKLILSYFTIHPPL
jgi:hypothetical protein